MSDIVRVTVDIFGDLSEESLFTLHADNGESKNIEFEEGKHEYIVYFDEFAESYSFDAEIAGNDRLDEFYIHTPSASIKASSSTSVEAEGDKVEIAEPKITQSFGEPATTRSDVRANVVSITSSEGTSTDISTSISTTSPRLTFVESDTFGEGWSFATTFVKITHASASPILDFSKSFTFVDGEVITGNVSSALPGLTTSIITTPKIPRSIGRPIRSVRRFDEGWVFKHSNKEPERVPEDNVSIGPATLELEFTVSETTKDRWLKPLETDAGKFEKYVEPNGLIRAIDRSGVDTNTFEVHPPPQYLPGLGIREWNVEEYEEEAVGRRSQMYRISFAMSRAETRPLTVPQYEGERTSDNEWKFELREEDVFTRNVKKDFSIDSAKPGLETYNLDLVLLPEPASVFLQTLEKQDVSTDIRVDDGRNYVLDNTNDLENMIHIKPPDGIAMPEALYDVVGWNATISDGTYNISLRLAKRYAGIKIREYTNTFQASTYTISNAVDDALNFPSRRITGDAEGLPNIRHPTDPNKFLGDIEGLYLTSEGSVSIPRYDIRRRAGPPKIVESHSVKNAIMSVDDGRYIYTVEDNSLGEYELRKIDFAGSGTTDVWSEFKVYPESSIDSLVYEDETIYVGGSNGEETVVEKIDVSGEEPKQQWVYDMRSEEASTEEPAEALHAQGGNIYIGSSEDVEDNMQKISPDGNKQWGYNIPSVVDITHDSEYVFAATKSPNEVRKIDESDDFPTTVFDYGHENPIKQIQHFGNFLYSATASGIEGVITKVDASGVDPVVQWIYASDQGGIFSFGFRWPFLYAAVDGSIVRLRPDSHGPSVTRKYSIDTEEVESIHIFE